MAKAGEDSRPPAVRPALSRNGGFPSFGPPPFPEEKTAVTDTNAMPLITAARVGAPPAWALLERNLIAQMEEAARLRFRQCTERGGAILYAEDFDDLFEQFYNWGLFYAMGADDSLLEMAATAWNATARISDESVVHRTRFNDHKKVFRPSARREFWNLQQAMEWHHLGEGMMAFYDFGVADPTISEMARRAQLFAGFYTGEDPEAPNYDPVHKVLRSPFQSSQGPLQEASAETAHAMLLAGRWLGSEVNYYGVRASLYPIVEDLELDWWEDPARQEEIVDLFNKLILQADTPNNLGAAALVTHAYLYTGDERYKRWVLEYTEAWMDPGGEERRPHARQRGTDRHRRRAPQRQLLGRPVRVEPLPGLQHHVPQPQHRRRVRRAADRGLRLPRLAARPGQGPPGRLHHEGGRPADHADRATVPPVGSTTRPCRGGRTRSCPCATSTPGPCPGACRS